MASRKNIVASRGWLRRGGDKVVGLAWEFLPQRHRGDRVEKQSADFADLRRSENQSRKSALICEICGPKLRSLCALWLNIFSRFGIKSARDQNGLHHCAGFVAEGNFFGIQNFWWHGHVDGRRRGGG